MSDIYNTGDEEQFWSERYRARKLSWDIGYPSTPIREYIDQLSDKSIAILVPGAGNGYEVEYLYRRGFRNTTILDISPFPLEEFSGRLPEFPRGQILRENFFEHQGRYDLVLEQTFFCSFRPAAENRMAYARKMWDLLNPGGKLVGLWFRFPVFRNGENPPYGGSREEYLAYWEPFFEIKTFEVCHNSIKPRLGNELFGILQRKDKAAK
ncbi:MAG TPA: methyltransferase domain-containing protein [Calditrichia bacterium]|nr:methyltransferase domain-containing protein [Calditrichota bacterium]HQV33085.1 methyltransferase domain-containing protein [Calditrichia bacterium]